MQKKTTGKTFMNIGSKNAQHSANYFKQIYRRSKLFRWQLKPRIKANSGNWIPPNDPWRGSAKIGSYVLYSNPPTNRNLSEYFTFEWLRHVRDFGGDKARIFAREEITLWIKENNTWEATRWSPKFLGERLCNLIFTVPLTKA